MSLVVDDPVMTYPTINVVWKQFLHVLDVANGLINYAPVFRDYFIEALDEFRLDNVLPWLCQQVLMDRWREELEPSDVGLYMCSQRNLCSPALFLFFFFAWDRNT
jgi:hypothetical protein